MINLPENFTSRHVGVAAEAFAAAQFARLGFDISVQYGADQPEYDLMVSKGDAIIKVSVKGSKDGSWGLTQSYCKEANYHAAADTWILKHRPKTIFCFVQFKNVQPDQLPRLYLATPIEVVKRLKETAKGRGDTILYEDYTYVRKNAHGYGTTDKIPDAWRFSEGLVNNLLHRIS